MPEIFLAFDLGILFTLSILSIVLGGILISEYILRKQNKKGILHFFLFVFLATFYFFINLYCIFFQIECFFIGIIAPILLMGYLNLILILLWKKLNKFLVGILLLMQGNFLFWSFLSHFVSEILVNSLHLVSIILGHFSLYFLIIKFLIDTYKR